MLKRLGEEMTDNSEFESARQIHTVLVMHFLEGLKQSDIAEMLNLSTSKVNRLIAQGRKLGMVRIEINSPFQRLVEMERCAYLRPTVLHCRSPQCPGANKEYMFPFVSVVECPQDKLLESIGPTLVCSAITRDEKWRQQLTDAVHIDRLNLGPIPTIKLDWLQPHEGNIVDFLFRARAFQFAKEMIGV